MIFWKKKGRPCPGRPKGLEVCLAPVTMIIGFPVMGGRIVRRWGIVRYGAYHDDVRGVVVGAGGNHHATGESEQKSGDDDEFGGS